MELTQGLAQLIIFMVGAILCMWGYINDPGIPINRRTIQVGVFLAGAALLPVLVKAVLG